MANFDCARIVMADRRRGHLLAYKGYMYSRNRAREDKLYWRCINKTCGAFVHTNVFAVSADAVNIRVLREPFQHGHRPQDSSILRRQLTERMASTVEADPCAPLRRAYDDVTARHTAAPADAVPPFHAVASRLARRRANCFPPVPSQLADVHINGEWSLTWNDRPNLSLLDHNWGVAVFMTEQHCRVLSSCDTVFIDGTFRTAPSPFYQLVTVHGLFRGAVIPLCFCLLSGKTVGHYRQLIEHVRNKIRQTCRRRWNPRNLICDFELALITAVETELPRTRVRGCYFHFSQSLWRKFSSLGMVADYRGSNRRGRRLKKVVQKIMSMGFLPSLLISRAFQDYVTSPTVLRAVRRHPRLAEFFRYVYHTYIGQNANFRPPMWCIYDRDMDMRTNNSVERYSSIVSLNS